MTPIEELLQTASRDNGESLFEQFKLFSEYMQKEDADLTSEQIVVTFVMFQIARLETMIKELEQKNKPTATGMLSSWECPRCHAIHSVLKMSCDCLPKTTKP